MRLARARFLIVPILFVVACVAAMAQQNSEIVGTVTDQTGAAVPGATLVLTQTETGFVYNSTSNSTGGYSFPGLNVGTYTLKATAKGFEGYTASGLTLNVSQTLAQEVAPFGVKVCTLEPGAIRTNWAKRASQDSPELLPEYEAAIRPVYELRNSLEGRAEGDPKKIAQVILALANSEDVPTRLVLGIDAERRLQQTEAARAEEAEKWRHLTHSTVFADAMPIPDLVRR